MRNCGKSEKEEEEQEEESARNKVGDLKVPSRLPASSGSAPCDVTKGSDARSVNLTKRPPTNKRQIQQTESEDDKQPGI